MLVNVERKGEFWKPHLLGYWIVVNNPLYDHRRLRKQPRQSVIYSILGHPVYYCSVQWKLCIMTSIFLKIQCIIYQSSELLKTCQKNSVLSFSILKLVCCDHTNNCASHFAVPLVPVICHSNVRGKNVDGVAIRLVQCIINIFLFLYDSKKAKFVRKMYWIIY